MKTNFPKLAGLFACNSRCRTGTLAFCSADLHPRRPPSGWIRRPCSAGWFLGIFLSATYLGKFKLGVAYLHAVTRLDFEFVKLTKLHQLWPPCAGPPTALGCELRSCLVFALRQGWARRDVLEASSCSAWRLAAIVTPWRWKPQATSPEQRDAQTVPSSNFAPRFPQR